MQLSSPNSTPPSVPLSTPISEVAATTPNLYPAQLMASLRFEYPAAAAPAPASVPATGAVPAGLPTCHEPERKPAPVNLPLPPASKQGGKRPRNSYYPNEEARLAAKEAQKAKRREQNRIAQRRLRDRKEEYIQKLEEQTSSLQTQLNSRTSSEAALEHCLRRLIIEREELFYRLRALGPSAVSLMTSSSVYPLPAVRGSSNPNPNAAPTNGGEGETDGRVMNEFPINLAMLGWEMQRTLEDMAANNQVLPSAPHDVGTDNGLNGSGSKPNVFIAPSAVASGSMVMVPAIHPHLTTTNCATACASTSGTTLCPPIPLAPCAPGDIPTPYTATTDPRLRTLPISLDLPGSRGIHPHSPDIHRDSNSQGALKAQRLNANDQQTTLSEVMLLPARALDSSCQA
ncbi:hypothetical protein ACQY0O_003416 [Thecaphora frezii]